MIRQVHPDRVPNASPYWKRAAEEKSKEINEAYHVLTDPAQRSSYDEQLVRYRQKTVVAPPPAAPKADVTPPPRPHSPPPDTAPQPRTHKRGYNWQPLKRWAGNYPLLAGGLGVILLVPVAGLFSGLRQNRSALATDSASASESPYSAFPCLEPRDSVSPIDGKPCRRTESAAPASEVADSNASVKHAYAAVQAVRNPNSYSVSPCGATESLSDVDHKPCKASAASKWFYMASNGIYPLDGEPDDDTCKRINAKGVSACKASLKFCPRGVWSKDCVSYSKWKKSVDPPRVEKVIPEWPLQ